MDTEWGAVDLISQAKAAKILNRTARCLALWRKRDVGPKCHDIFGRWYYSKSECEAYRKGMEQYGAGKYLPR